MFSKFTRISILISLLFIISAACIAFFKGNIIQLEPDFYYRARIISKDNFYDRANNKFKGDILSNTIFNYYETKRDKKHVEIKNVFDVRTPSGKPIFAVTRHYGVNPATGQHIMGFGDKDRHGYLFAPKHLNKQAFYYWHINYDTAAYMQFLIEDTINGLPVYVYQSNFIADQTPNLSHLPNVPEQYGIELDVSLKLWIEPITGIMIKYEDETIGWYYDIKTKERQFPWNKFSNQFEEISVLEQVDKVNHRIQKYNLYHFYLPSLLLLIAILCLIIGYKRNIKDSVRTIISVGLTLMLGVLASFIISKNIKRNIDKDLRTKFNDECEAILDDLQTDFESNINVLSILRSAFEAQPNLTQNQFNILVSGALNRSESITIIGFAKRVPHKLRKNYEDELKKLGYTHQQIYCKSQGQPIACPIDSVYYPLTFLTPLEQNQSAIGFNMLSDSIRNATFQSALLTSEVSSTQPLILVQDSANNNYSIIMVNPVYDNQKVVGFVTAVVVIKSVLTNQLANRLNKLFTVTITDNEANQQFSYGNHPTLDSKYAKSGNLRIANRLWKVNFKADEKAYELNRYSMPNWIMLIGVLITVLAASFIYYVLSDNKKELLRANQELSLTANHLQLKINELEQFAYVSSHDLQEPLGTISNFTELINTEFANKLPGQSELYFNFIHEAAKRMQNLIKGLLDYTIIGKTSNFSLIETNKLVDTIVKNNKQRIKSIDALISVEQLPNINGVQEEIQLIFSHLIDNSLTYITNTKQPKIKIGCLAKKHENIFYVSDNGIGIAQKHQHKIFDIFKRLHNREEYEGTGIGLAQCKKIIRHHQGNIWVKSEVNEGSTFYFSIPK